MNQTFGHRGMALIELMGVLILLGVFAVISGQLFTAVLHVTVESHEAPRPDRQREAVAAKLRGDVWGAMEVRVPAPNALILRYAGDKSVTWNLGGTAEAPELRRRSFIGTQTIEETTWGAEARVEAFESFGPGVRVGFGPAKHDPAVALDLYSQLIQLTGGRK